MQNMGRETYWVELILKNTLTDTPPIPFEEIVSCKIRIPGSYVSTSLTPFMANKPDGDYARVYDVDGLEVSVPIPEKSFTFDETDVSVANNTITETAHGLVDGEEVYFTSTTVLPAGLIAGTKYFVVSATANDFKVSLTKGGAAVDITDQGTAGVNPHKTWVTRWITLSAALVGAGYVKLVTSGADTTKKVLVLRQS